LYDTTAETFIAKQKSYSISEKPDDRQNFLINILITFKTTHFSAEDNSRASQETPSVGGKDKTGYLRFGNTKFFELSIHYDSPSNK